MEAYYITLFLLDLCEENRLSWFYQQWRTYNYTMLDLYKEYICV